MMLLIKLLLAHLIGDFFLQSKASIAQKEKRKWLAPHLFLHVFIHFGLIMLIAGLEYWLLAVVITVLHYIIDGVKLQFQRQASRQVWFFADQAMHIGVIATGWLVYAGLPQVALGSSVILSITGFIFLTRPASLSFPWL